MCQRCYQAARYAIRQNKTTEQELEAAGLLLDEAAEAVALFERELTVVEAHVAEEDDIILGELVEAGGEFLEVVAVAATDFAEPRVE